MGRTIIVQIKSCKEAGHSVSEITEHVTISTIPRKTVKLWLLPFREGGNSDVHKPKKAVWASQEDN